MSIIDYIKSLFTGEAKEEAKQDSHVTESTSAEVYVAIDKTPTLENVARFVVKTRKSKGADIQRYFQIGYKLAGELMSQLQQKGIIDNAFNVLVDTNISESDLTQLLSKDKYEAEDSYHISSASGFEIKIISSSPTNIETHIEPYIPDLSKYECYVVFDTETSGLSPQQGHEILQIGAVKYCTQTGKVIDTRSIYTIYTQS